ncbi:hypothetical protein [Streptomyces shenzhenensis]|uniref:DUF732 domain-containing protein n=1 Tax=Streptomyces shenzhenensis TaxID=943815 RepID=A0A3M0HZV4_9ACTN|nr:hypothetical protein [Streptomyces shenzhenensis]RMB79953.1 hypothetical protein CTZ28_42980 [Streptomyces shenzhenensis]
MHVRRTAVAATAALAFALVGCSSDNGQEDTAAKPSPSNTPSVSASATEEAAGIPPKPDAATSEVLLDVLKAINPALVKDEDKTIDNARNQCSTINGGGKADQAAKDRFSTSDHEVTDAEAAAINAALTASLCKS